MYNTGKKQNLKITHNLTKSLGAIAPLQGDQLNMAVFNWTPCIIFEYKKWLDLQYIGICMRCFSGLSTALPAFDSVHVACHVRDQHAEQQLDDTTAKYQTRQQHA